jgi:histidinol-phosphatase (PHP family)
VAGLTGMGLDSRNRLMKLPARVSIHGGHSGQFCTHATDSLEEIVKAYVRKGFQWVGITEHIPPVDDRFVYPDDARMNLDARRLYHRFENYVSTCRRLQHTYRNQIELLVGFEIETYEGAPAFVQRLITAFRPDYIVGSVHHVDNIGFDYSPQFYRRAAEAAGDLETLYLHYFDAQSAMIERLRPPVIGHFDLIRIFDPDYEMRLKRSVVAERIDRNLNQIKDEDLILEVNVRALSKGAVEPYPARTILRQAVELGIAVVPGDDSHGVDSVGRHIDTAIEILAGLGADTNWRKPHMRA